MAKKDKNYEVGYGRPPTATRFKPGRSGNPKGRPKGSKNLKTLVSEVYLEPVPLRDKTSGGTRNVPTIQAVLLRMKAGALGTHFSGKPVEKHELPAMTEFIALGRALGLFENVEAERPEDQHSEILAAYVKRKKVPPEGEGNA